MAGHTKGPWYVHDAIDGPITNTDVRSGDVKWVARCGPLFGRPHAPGSEIEANARLIAAAPELLEALRQLVGNADLAAHIVRQNDEGGYLASALFDTIRQAEAVIAKATQSEGAR